jgi:hypothetical protein
VPRGAGCALTPLAPPGFGPQAAGSLAAPDSPPEVLSNEHTLGDLYYLRLVSAPGSKARACPPPPTCPLVPSRPYLLTCEVLSSTDSPEAHRAPSCGLNRSNPLPQAGAAGEVDGRLHALQLAQG